MYQARSIYKKSGTLHQAWNKKYAIAALGFLAIIFLFLKFKSFIIFLIICAIAASLNYFIHTTSIHLHLGHVSFMAIIFSYTLGWQYGIVMIAIAHILAELLAGHADIELFNTGIIYTINVFIASFMQAADIVALGLGLTVFQAISTSILGSLTGAPLLEILTEDGLEFVMLIIYFILFAKPLVGLIG